MHASEREALILKALSPRGLNAMDVRISDHHLTEPQIALIDAAGIRPVIAD